MGELELQKRVLDFFYVCIAMMIALALAVQLEGVVVSNVTAADDQELPKQFRIGFMQKVDSLNPYVGVSDAAYVFYGLVYDTLDVIDNDLNPAPNMATGIYALPESDPYMVANGLKYGTVWQYNITTEAYWSDGEPFTAEDANWSVNINAFNFDGLWAFQPYSYFMQYAEVKDEKTLWIHYYDRETGEPMPASYAYLLSIYMLPKHRLEGFSIEDIGFKWPGVFKDDPMPIVGTGPFIASPTIYDDWLRGDPIVLKKNPDYHWSKLYTHPDGRPMEIQFDEIVLKFYDETLAMTLALKNNQLDVAQFPPQDYYNIRRDVVDGKLDHITTFDGPKVTQYWTEIGMCQKKNNKNPSRLDPVIRHALAQAVNKTWIVENYYLGLADEGTTLIPPINSYWHYEPTEAQKWKYDLAAARALLESNGYIDFDLDGVREATASSPAVTTGLVVENTELRYEMLIRAEYPEEKYIAERLQLEWKDIGIVFDYTIVDEPTMNQIVYSYDYDMMIWYWSSDVDPNYMLYTQTSMAIDGWNDDWYHSVDYDKNYTESVFTMDRTLRKGFVDNCQLINYQDAAYIILAYPYQTYAWRTDTFEGWGDWKNDPGRSIDNFWTGNPLYFDLVPKEKTVIPPEVLYIAIGAGAAAAVIAALVILRMRRRKKEGEIRGEETSPLGD